MTSVAHAVPHSQLGTELVRDWVPTSEPRAVIVLLHGVAEHSGRYERTGGLLADAGFHVRSFDAIGHGATGGSRVDIAEWELFYDQIDVHMKWAAGQGAPLVLMGHSMGGLLALGYVLDNRIRPDLPVLSAPAMDGGAAWQKKLAGVAARIAPTLSIPQAIKGEHLSRDPEVGEAYFSDPLVHTGATTRFGKALFDAMAEARDNVTRLDIPTLVLHGGDDQLVPVASTEIFTSIEGCERRLYEDLRHEILNEPEGPQVVGEIIDWIGPKI